MEPTNRRHLQTPQGTEGISLDEAFRHRGAVRLAEDLFASWGYLPAQLPVFDYYDSYRALLDQRSLDATYRLVDRSGEVLMLRSDITLFLAKHLGAHAGAHAGPRRVCYADSILRHQESVDISHDEYYQLGAELIGVPGVRGEIEVAALLGELFADLAVSSPVFHVGSRRLLDSIAVSLAAATRNEAARSIADRDWEHLDRLVPEASRLFSFIGSRDEFARFIDEETIRQADETKSAINELLTFADAFARVDHPFDVRIDLSEIGSQHYHTGIAFNVYADGVATAVASGGRYDDLLRHFGDQRPAVGFSTMLRKVMPILNDPRRFDPPEPVRVDVADPVRAIAEAKQLRSEGKVVTL